MEAVLSTGTTEKKKRAATPAAPWILGRGSDYFTIRVPFLFQRLRPNVRVQEKSKVPAS